MRACESFEVHISALMDGEVTRGDVFSLLDHLPSCSSCRSFYRESRTLQEVADTMPIAALEERDAPGVSSPPLSSRRLVPWSQRWAWGIAAGMLLAVGLWLGQTRLRSERSVPEILDVVLEERKGEMSEARFFEMAIELLESDRRFQRQMFDLLQRVERSRFVEEGALDFAARHGEDLDWAEEAPSDDDTPRAGAVSSQARGDTEAARN